MLLCNIIIHWNTKSLRWMPKLAYYFWFFFYMNTYLLSEILWIFWFYLTYTNKWCAWSRNPMGRQYNMIGKRSDAGPTALRNLWGSRVTANLLTQFHDRKNNYTWPDPRIEPGIFGSTAVHVRATIRDQLLKRKAGKLNTWKKK